MLGVLFGPPTIRMRVAFQALQVDLTEGEIMAVPKRRVSHARQGKRRSHHHLKARENQYCNRCGVAVKPHSLCWNCGWSNIQGRELVSMETKES